MAEPRRPSIPLVFSRVPHEFEPCPMWVNINRLSQGASDHFILLSAEENPQENMETPPPEPPMRRTRNALVEIPARMGALSMSENRRSLNAHFNTTMGLWMETNLSAYMSPSPSPDELVIQQRGRKKLPETWSPDIDTSRRSGGDLSPSKERTPVKSYGSTSPSSKSSIVLRSTPRKRLLMNDTFEMTPSPEKKLNFSPNAKKMRMERPLPPMQGELDLALRALSSEQLIAMVQGLVTKHSFLEEEIKKDFPAPDLKPLEERLHDLKRNIFKSLPTSRLTSKTDSPAYNRAATHVTAFKKCLLEQGRMIAGSQQWETLIDFVLMAWRYVSATPLWDNPPHNAMRRQCFKFLAAQCMSALKKLQWTNEQCDVMSRRLEGFVQDSEDVKSCLKQIDSMRKK